MKYLKRTSLFPATAIAVLLWASLTDASGLPGQYLLSNRWRILLSARSALSNPAFMTDQNYFSVRGAFCGGLESAGNLWEISAVMPVRLYHSVGLGCITENGGDVTSTLIDNRSGEFTETSVTANASNYFIMASYAINPWRRLSAGANVNIAYNTGFGDPVYGIGMDLGLSYRLLNHAAFGYHHFGIMYQNLIAPSPSEQQIDDYSPQLKATLHSRFWENRVESILEVNLADFPADAESFARGNEPVIEWELSYVLGIWFLRAMNLYGILGADRHGMQYWGLAGGFNVPAVNNGRDFVIAYQFRNEIDNPMQPAHTVYFRADFGKHREESTIRKIGLKMSIAPNLLYNRAMELFNAQRYWDALLVFSEIASRFPDFFKMDWVTYYRGRCYEELDMRKIAGEEFAATTSNYTRSIAVPHAQLGLMRVHYRNGNFSEVFNQYINLNTPNVPDSLKYHGCYYMGEALLKSGRTREAIMAFEKIPESHSEYIFARHSAGVASFIAGNMEEGREHLMAVLTPIPKTTAQTETISRTYLLLGYSFYEDGALAKSVTALRLVSKTSFYYEDALLGLGWTAIKAHQWSDCVRTGQELQRITNNFPLKGEGILFEAAGMHAQKRYVEAASLAANGAQMLKQLAPPSTDSLHSRRQKATSDRVLYDFLAAEVDRVSLLGRQTAGMPVFDSLRTRQHDMKKQLDEHQAFEDDFSRRLLFGRSLNNIKTDLDYIQAVAGKRSSERKVIEAGREMIDKQKHLDAAIEELQKEMEGIEPKEE